MNHNGRFSERGHSVGSAAARVLARAYLVEGFEAPHFRYSFQCLTPRDPWAVIQLRAAIEEEVAQALDPSFGPNRLLRLERELAEQPLEVAWQDEFVNTVVTAGKNDILGKYFAGSAYTAAFNMGLVDGTSAPTIVAGDTMASHAGWTENTAYSNAARPTLAFAAASGGSIALSASATFNINAAATIAGAFFATNSTKGGTTGVLYSAGAFTGGNKTVSSGDTLSVSATQAV